MKKSYSGYSLPNLKRVSYTLDYRCPNCHSKNVAIDISVPVPHFCDGGPSSADELRMWICKDCNHHSRGLEFARRVPLVLAFAQKCVSFLRSVYRKRWNKLHRFSEQKKCWKAIISRQRNIMNYSIIEHKHRFPSWEASRGARGPINYPSGKTISQDKR